MPKAFLKYLHEGQWIEYFGDYQEDGLDYPTQPWQPTLLDVSGEEPWQLRLQTSVHDTKDVLRWLANKFPLPGGLRWSSSDHPDEGKCSVFFQIRADRSPNRYRQVVYQDARGVYIVRELFRYFQIPKAEQVFTLGAQVWVRGIGAPPAEGMSLRELLATRDSATPAHRFESLSERQVEEHIIKRDVLVQSLRQHIDSLYVVVSGLYPFKKAFAQSFPPEPKAPAFDTLSRKGKLQELERRILRIAELRKHREALLDLLCNYHRRQKDE